MAITGETNAFAPAEAESAANAEFGEVSAAAVELTHAVWFPDTNDEVQPDPNTGALTLSKLCSMVVPSTTCPRWIVKVTVPRFALPS